MPDPQRSTFEEALHQLAPAPPAWSRDRLFFGMGRASARRGWAWPAATALATLTAACLAFLLLTRPAAPGPVRVVRVPVPAGPVEEHRPEEPTRAPSADLVHYLRLREDVVREGLDGLPALPELADDSPPLPEAALYPF